MLFDRVDNANQKDLESGDFKSVDFQQACGRLKNIGGVEILSSIIRNLESLRKRRNVIRHYKTELELAQVRSLLAECLNFCHDFCVRELQSATDDDKTKEMLSDIWQHLIKNDEFVSLRLQTIAPEIEGLQVWDCPDCWQTAVVGTEDDIICKFCSVSPDPENLAGYNTIGGLGYCAGCWDMRETVALVKPISGGVMHMCFYCGSTGRNLEECFKCGEGFLLPGGGDEDVWFCDSCWEYIMAE